MSIAQVDVSIDQEEIRKYINEQLDQTLRQSLLFWDIVEMEKRMCMSRSFIENEFLHDPRLKLLERRKEKGKRFYPYEESLRIITSIMDSW